MPQFDYDMPELLLGQIGDSTPEVIDSYLNELLPQLSEITLAANGAGTYTVQVTDGDRVFTGSFLAGAPDAIATIIDELITDLLLTMANEVSLVNNDPVLEMTFLFPGIDWVITFPSNPLGNMSVASSQAAGGTNVPLATAMAQSANGDNIARLPTAGTDVLLGVSVRNIDIQTNIGGSGVTETEPGDEFSLMRVGATVVQATTTVAAGNPVFVRHAAATVAEPLGSMSATDDANTVQLPGARWRTSTTGAGLARVIVNNP